jgi:FHA domain/Double zinc ribbon
MIRCPRCNTELPDGVSFCDACGAPVRGQMPPANPVYQPFAGAAPAPVPGGQMTCPVCGTPVLAGEAFCDNCGAALLTDPGATLSHATQPPPFAAPQAPAPVAPPPFAPSAPPPFAAAPLVPAPAPAPVAAATGTRPRLVVVSSRAELPLPARDDIIVGREDAQSNSYPDVDLNPHGGLEQGVSRRHARITQRGGQWFVEDLNSVNGTLLNQKRIPANSPQPLQPGDQVMLGRLGLTFETV